MLSHYLSILVVVFVIFVFSIYVIICYFAFLNSYYFVVVTIL